MLPADATRADAVGHQFGRLALYPAGPAGKAPDGASLSGPGDAFGRAADATVQRVAAPGASSVIAVAPAGSLAAPSGARSAQTDEGVVAVQRFTWPFDVTLYRQGLAQSKEWSGKELPLDTWPDLVALLGRLPPERMREIAAIKEKHEHTKADSEEAKKSRALELAFLARSSAHLLLACKTFYSRYMTASAGRYARGQGIEDDLPRFAKSIAIATGQGSDLQNIATYLDQIAAIATWANDQLYAQLGVELSSRDIFWETREHKDTEGPRQVRVAVAGAGPAGLAAAIEARLMGARVTLFEWRERYERVNAITLRQQAIDKLKYFGVYDKLFKGPDAKGLIDIGGQPALAIMYLEEALLERAHQLGVLFERGASIASITPHGGKRLEVKSPERGEPQAEAEEDDEPEEPFDYDILVAADAKQSALRGVSTDLARQSIHGGHAIVYAAAQFAAGNTDIKRATGPEVVEGLGTFQVPAPNVYYVLMEVPAPVLEKAIARAQRRIAAEDKARTRLRLDKLTLDDQKNCMDAAFQEGLEQLGKAVAKQSARMGKYGLGGAKAKKIAPFDVELTQARSFADPGTGVVLVGDAAATTNPFEGQGASTALYESGLVSELVERFNQETADRVKALDAYDKQMREITTRFMIEKPLQQESPDYYARAGIVWRDQQGNYFVSTGGKTKGQPNLKRVPTPGRA